MVNVFMKKKLFIITIITFLIDRISKILVMNKLALYKENVLIKNLLNIKYVKNDGAAWSIMNGNTIILVLIAIVALGAISYYLFKSNLKKIEEFLYAILIGGIIGNLIDRIIFKYVIDYIGVIIFGYYFPVFNFADICIVLSIIILLARSFKEDLCAKK